MGAGGALWGCKKAEDQIVWEIYIPRGVRGGFFLWEGGGAVVPRVADRNLV